MKIFATIGTTNFPELIQEVDRLSTKKFDITCQIANVKPKPKNVSFFRFTENIDFYYNNFDVFICHAGAGTIYTLLELNKKIIVVPNHRLKDNHQNDICTFIEKENLGFVAWDLSEIEFLLSKIDNYTFSAYSNSDSTICNSIIEIIKNDI
jgi:beta-1,4-N-acetylglucosaminyltransferase